MESPLSFGGPCNISVRNFLFSPIFGFLGLIYYCLDWLKLGFSEGGGPKGIA